MTASNFLIAERTDNSFAALPAEFYTRVQPQPLTDPWLVHANPDAAALLGLSPDDLATPEFLAVFSGARGFPGSDPLAAVYSGHQFGVWAGQLGDGRALLLGEVVGPQGRWEVQLKGSGRTPYSRMGDGKAVLRSSVREYLASEAMHGLGIATTRALALTASDEPVIREAIETAAVVTRLAPSFVRFGSFEHWASAGRPDLLRTLADYVIDRFYPECRPAPAGEPDAAEGPYRRLLAAVVRRTAELMADWQAVGFCHGVMNTDNMSILGLTLDYGPYGFMDGFDAHHICNHTDAGGRYAWDAQPAVGHWNLYRLAGALLPLLGGEDAARAALDGYEAAFLGRFHRNMAAKLGLLEWTDADAELLASLLTVMHHNRADFTLAFRRLAAVEREPRPQAGSVRETFEDLFADRDAAGRWLNDYRARLARQAEPDAARAARMNRVNPLYVLRNHLAELAIRAARQRDPSEIDRLLGLLRDPYTERPGSEAYAALPPDWAGSLEVSCSS
ncbi:YdiU family protein [Pigmentiphaga soli]|uniref:Protein nucleotidyltransferase YdiU n=1 Tax=Pigmentiphaga soli TaxID=1007095 RepID=A0ABP8HG83_9BURK